MSDTNPDHATPDSLKPAERAGKEGLEKAKDAEAKRDASRQSEMLHPRSEVDIKGGATPKQTT